MTDFNEFELLTLREGLFAFKNDSEFYNLTDEEFEQIDNKLKELIEGL